MVWANDFVLSHPENMHKAMFFSRMVALTFGESLQNQVLKNATALRHTALHIAMATCQSVDIPKALFASRRFTMDAVNAKDKSGHTALHIAARIESGKKTAI